MVGAEADHSPGCGVVEREHGPAQNHRGTDDPDRIEFRIGPTTELGAMIGGWPLARAGDPVLYAGMPYKTKEYLELLKGNP